MKMDLLITRLLILVSLTRKNNFIFEVGSGINKFSFSEVNTNIDVTDNLSAVYLDQIKYSRELSNKAFPSILGKVSYAFHMGNLSIGPYLAYVYNFYSEELEIRRIMGDLSPLSDNPIVLDFNENSNIFLASARAFLIGGVRLGYNF
jgi:hypothetical protein